MKVFLDTNAWLSATVFSGLCEELVLQCADRGWLYSSELVRQESHEVLIRKFPKRPDACALFNLAWQSAELIDDLAEPQDDNDVRLVTATALAGMALFVTGDKRVLSWQSRTGPAGLMQIASPRQAWQMLFGVGPQS